MIWAVVFSSAARTEAPQDLVTRQCRLLFQGCVLELMIAVPTHIVARYRDYCCAGVMTFIGLTMGSYVMLFAFGPARACAGVNRARNSPDNPAQAP